MHEAACHNRERDGTTDFSQTVTARQNHAFVCLFACDLLAGAAGQQGRSHELDFYGGLRPQECSTNFFAKAGVPMFFMSRSRASAICLPGPAPWCAHANQSERGQYINKINLWSR